MAGVALGAPVAVAEAVGVAEGVTVGLAVAVAAGVAVAVAVAVAVGDGVASQTFGPRIPTVTGVPVLKKPIVALVARGGWLESNRKLYNVPHRMAFAFWFCPNVSVLQPKSPAFLTEDQGVLL